MEHVSRLKKIDKTNISLKTVVQFYKMVPSVANEMNVD